NSIVPQIIKTNGKLARPGLGIAIGSDQIAQKMGITGVIVMQVQPGSAADKAGLQGMQRDPDRRGALADAITGLGRTPIASPNDVLKTLGHHEVGDKIEARVTRGSSERGVEVALQEIPQ